MSNATRQENPYVGLRPFDIDDSLYYFGRNAQIKALLQRLRQHRFLAVVGASGSGKSSLVRAGLIPHLMGGFLIQQRDEWQIVTMKPGVAPLEHLLEAIRNNPDEEPDPSAFSELQEKIKTRGAWAILDYIRPALDRNKASFFLLVDQFEELFRFAEQSNQLNKAAEFVSILLQLAEQDDLPVHVCLTMRSDFIGDCDRFHGLPETMNRCQYLVPRLTRSQRREAIVGPARLSGTSVAPRLLDRLLNEQIDTRDDLPILQHALMRTWDEWAREGQGLMDLPNYEAIHTIQHALSDHADEALSELDAGDQKITKRLFQSLTEIDSGNRRIRRPSSVKEVARIADTSEDKVRSIIATFRDKGRAFLVLTSEESAGAGLIDISHESLIRQWSTLRDWVDEEAESAKVYRRLAETAELHGEKKAGLYRDPDLQVAMDWQMSQEPSSAWAERYGFDYSQAIAFLAASKAKRLDEEASAARERDQKLQKTRQLLMGTAMALLAMILLALYALGKKVEAEQAKQTLQTNNLALLTTSNQLADNIQELTSAKVKAELLTHEALGSSNKLEQARLTLKANNTALLKTSEQLTNTIKELTLAKNDAESNRLDAVSAKMDADNEKLIRTRGLFESHLTQASLLSRNEDFLAASTILELSTELDPDIPTNRLPVRNVMNWFTKLRRPTPNRNIELTTPLRGVAISPSGDLVVTVGENGANSVFQASDNRILKTWMGHTGNVNAVVFDPHGAFFASAGDDRQIELWNATDFSHNKTFSSAGDVLSLALDPLGKFLAVGGTDDDVTVWNIKNETKVNLIGHNSDVTALAFSPSTNHLASASSDGRIYIWDMETRRLIGQYPDAAGPGISGILGLAYHPDGTRLASSSEDQSVRIWDLKTGVYRSYIGHNSTVPDLAFLPKGRRLVTASLDRTLRLWDIESGVTLAILQGHEAGVNAVTVSKDQILSVGIDKSLRYWQPSLPGMDILEFAPFQPTAAAISEEGHLLAVGFEDGRLRMNSLTIDSTSQQPQAEELWEDDDSASGKINRLVFANSGETFLLASSDGTLSLRNSSSGEVIKNYDGHNNNIDALALSPDEQRFATATTDLIRIDRKQISSSRNAIGIFDINSETGKFFDTADERILSLMFHPNGKQLLTSSSTGNVSLWSIDGGNLTRTIDFPKDHDPVSSATFSPDGSQVAAGGRSASTRIFTTEPVSTPVTELFGHENTLMRLSYLPESNVLITAAADATLKFWDLDNEHELFTLPVPALSATFSDGRTPLKDFALQSTDEGHVWMAVPLAGSRLALYFMEDIY